MKNSPLYSKMVLSIVGVLTIAYVGACAYLYARQTRMIFFPSASIETTPADFKLSYQDIWLPVDSNDPPSTLHGWWIPAVPEAGVVLYLHGNGVNVGANVGQAARFNQLGLSVFLVDYRGYGQSTGGFPTEAKVYEDAEVAWNYLVNQRGIAPEQILIYGHSLGGAIAIDLAIRHPDAAGLIVQSSFTSMRDMAHRTTAYGFLPINLLLTQRFESITKIPRLDMPVLFIHGKADVQIPYDMSRSLYNQTPDPKELWLVPDAGHNNVADTAGPEYLRVVREFMGRSLLQTINE